MSRWEREDRNEIEQNSTFESDEESRLIKKFYDYLDIETIEKDRRRSLEKKVIEKKNKISPFVFPIFGGMTLMGLTFAFLSLWGFR